MLLVPVLASALALGSALLPIATPPSAAGAPSSDAALSVTPMTATWTLDPTRYGSTVREALSHRPCLRADRGTHRTVVCLTGKKQVRVRHVGYRTGYRLPAEVTRSGTGVTVRMATADLMLRPGRASLSEKCRRGCAPRKVTVGSTKVPIRVLESCRAKSPWLFNSRDTREKVVALTLDDGPSQYTRSAIKILRKAGVPATFFVVGVHARTDPKALRKLRARGHVLANHTYNHPDLSTLPEAEVAAELRRTTDVIRSATSFTTCMFRAPYGENPPNVVQVARQLGLATINWNAGAHDYLSLSSSAITRQTLETTKPGSIILLHDGGGNRAATLAALPGIIKTLRDRGYRFVTVPDLLDISPTYR